MAHYRKIDIRIWLDKKFNALSSDSQFVFLYLLTHPQLTALGAMRSTVPGLSAELDWPLDRFEAAFEALCQQELVAIDKKACFVWAMNFLKYNPPESPNVVKSWGTCLEYLPECDLKNNLIQKTHNFLKSLPTTFQEALPTYFKIAPLCTTYEVTDNLSKGIHPLSSSLPVTFTEALPEGLEEGLEQPFAKTSINHRALNIKHKTLSIKQEQEELIQENNLEEKEEIEEIKNIVTPARQKNAKPPDTEIVEVFSYWKQTMQHPQAVLDAKRRKRIRQALASGYSVAQLCEAILGCSCTPHNIGDNEQGQRYDGLHVILRDAEQIDRFIRNAHSPPRPQNAADRLLNTNAATGQRWLHKKLQEQQQREKTVYECA